MKVFAVTVSSWGAFRVVALFSASDGAEKCAEWYEEHGIGDTKVSVQEMTVQDKFTLVEGGYSATNQD